MRVVERLKISTLMGSFGPKFELEKYRRVTSHDTEEWYKIWKKSDLVVQIWHEEFGEFSPNP